MTEVPKVFKDVCLSCHSAKSFGLKGGGSAPDIAQILKKAKKYGGFESYIREKYKTDPYEFFLYPSKYVPAMALVEGRVYSKDVDELIKFFNSLPVEDGRGFPIAFLIPILLVLLALLFKLRKKKRFMVS